MHELLSFLDVVLSRLPLLPHHGPDPMADLRLRFAVEQELMRPAPGR